MALLSRVALLTPWTALLIAFAIVLLSMAVGLIPLLAGALIGVRAHKNGRSVSFDMRMGWRPKSWITVASLLPSATWLGLWALLRYR